jgi:hypothetical protein
MSDTETRGVPTAGTGCCGAPSPAVPAVPDTAEVAGPCCGTATDAAAEGACCGSGAKADAVAAGQGCCG